jgi:hypothetical protein
MRRAEHSAAGKPDDFDGVPGHDRTVLVEDLEAHHPRTTPGLLGKPRAPSVTGSVPLDLDGLGAQEHAGGR